MAHANRSNKLAVCFGTTSKTIYTTKVAGFHPFLSHPVCYTCLSHIFSILGPKLAPSLSLYKSRYNNLRKVELKSLYVVYFDSPCFQTKPRKELEFIILRREEKTKSNFNLFSEMTHCYNFITSLKCHKIVSKAITKI